MDSIGSASPAQGVRIAQEAAAAASRDDYEAMSRVVNAGSREELMYAVGHLAALLVMFGDKLMSGSAAQKRRNVRDAVVNEEDVLATQIRALSEKRNRRG